MTATCFECGRPFVADDGETDICGRCQIEWLRENVPEAFAVVCGCGALADVVSCNDCYRELGEVD